jgi:YD repeat-containing protein
MNRRFITAVASVLALLAASPAAAGTEYFYDSAGRLIKVIYSNGITVQYRYDAAGNRTEIVTSNTPNHAPDAINDTVGVATSTAVNISVRNNDTDSDSNPLTITSVTAPSGGTAVIQGGGTYIRYTAPSSSGAKTFHYTISDGAGGTDTATVTVTVTAVNTPPVAVDDTASTPYGTSVAIMVRSNDYDADNHTLTVTSLTTPTGGTATISSGGGYINYNAPLGSSGIGTHTFSYTISDGHGGADTATVTVEVTSGEVGTCNPEFEVCGP